MRVGACVGGGVGGFVKGVEGWGGLQGGRVFLMAPEPSAGLCSCPVIGRLPDTVFRPDKTQKKKKGKKIERGVRLHSERAPKREGPGGEGGRGETQRVLRRVSRCA